MIAVGRSCSVVNIVGKLRVYNVDSAAGSVVYSRTISRLIGIELGVFNIYGAGVVVDSRAACCTVICKLGIAYIYGSSGFSCICGSIIVYSTAICAGCVAREGCVVDIYCAGVVDGAACCACAVALACVFSAEGRVRNTHVTCVADCTACISSAVSNKRRIIYCGCSSLARNQSTAVTPGSVVFKYGINYSHCTICISQRTARRLCIIVVEYGGHNISRTILNKYGTLTMCFIIFKVAVVGI